MKLTETGRHNLKIIPVVIFIRLPLMFPFWIAQSVVGLGNKLDQILPGLRYGRWFEKDALK